MQKQRNIVIHGGYHGDLHTFDLHSIGFAVMNNWMSVLNRVCFGTSAAALRLGEQDVPIATGLLCHSYTTVLHVICVYMYMQCVYLYVTCRMHVHVLAHKAFNIRQAITLHVDSS